VCQFRNGGRGVCGADLGDDLEADVVKKGSRSVKRLNYDEYSNLDHDVAVPEPLQHHHKLYFFIFTTIHSSRLVNGRGKQCHHPEAPPPPPPTQKKISPQAQKKPPKHAQTSALPPPYTPRNETCISSSRPTLPTPRVQHIFKPAPCCVPYATSGFSFSGV
jgi:hypothetical protein